MRAYASFSRRVARFTVVGMRVPLVDVSSGFLSPRPFGLQIYRSIFHGVSRSAGAPGNGAGASFLTTEKFLTMRDRERLLNSMDRMRNEVVPKLESQHAKEAFELVVSHLNGEIALEEMLTCLTEDETGNEQVEEAGGASKQLQQQVAEDDGPHLSVPEFLRLIQAGVTKFDDWEVQFFEKGSGSSVNTEEDLQQLRANAEVRSVDVIRVIVGETDFVQFKSPFTEKALVGTFLSDNRLKQVTDFLASTIKPVLDAQQPQHGLMIPAIQEGVVETNGDLLGRLQIDPQTDKNYAIVVTGESGSGKTVHSCQIPAAHGFCCLYAAIQPSDLKEKVKPDENIGAWHYHLRHVMEDVGAAHPDVSSLRTSGLHDLYNLLPYSQVGWALDIFERVVRRALKDDAACTNWWLNRGRFTEDEKPRNLALIIDQITDIDLARGLIERVRDIYAEKRNGLVRSSFRIILCGTGLDAVNRSSQSRVVIMKPFHPANIGTNLKSVVLNAIADCTMPRVLSTNTRAFFRAVYPLMSMPAHEVDLDFDDGERKRRFESRLREIGSCGPLMDYAVRNFVSHTFANVDSGREKGLLDACFLYHLASSVKSSPNLGKAERDGFLQHLLALKPEQDDRLWDIENGTVTTDEEIFSRGLAMRDGSTSTALKYLSFASLSGLEAVDGDAFEDLVRLHLTRLFSILGYTVISRDLTHGWPPQSVTGDNDVSKEEIKTLADDLSKTSEKCLQKDVVLKDILESKTTSTEKWCVLCRQGSTNGQGAELLVVRCEGENGAVCVDAIHTRHGAAALGASDCWRSLGIDATSDGGGSPKVGSAGYYYQGLMSFLALLRRQGFDTVTLGKRVLAVSEVAEENDESWKLNVTNNVDGTAVWTREFLEPTFSCLQPDVEKRVE